MPRSMVRKRGKSGKKMTLAICPKTHEILFNIPSDDSIGDTSLFKEALRYIPSTVREVIMDRAGDNHDIYRQAQRQSIRLIAPPRKGSKYLISPQRTERDEHIKMIHGLGNHEEAIKEWKRRNGYHRRSLVETAISRLKGILGGDLKSRTCSTSTKRWFLKQGS